MYKALDVREYKIIGKSQYFQSRGSSATGDLHLKQHRRVIVIAEDVATTARVRFEFFEAYEFKFGDKTHYGGYLGDYELLVPGDFFMIEKTSAQEKVTLCNS